MGRRKTGLFPALTLFIVYPKKKRKTRRKNAGLFQRNIKRKISKKLNIRQTERKTPFAFWRVAVRHSLSVRYFLAKLLRLPPPTKLTNFCQFCFSPPCRF
jgi:hypothetical protein